jgi:hypothetical protein
MSDDVRLSLALDTPERIAQVRADVLAQHAKGQLSREERGRALGTLAEAEALLRLRNLRKDTR